MMFCNEPFISSVVYKRQDVVDAYKEKPGNQYDSVPMVLFNHPKVASMMANLAQSNALQVSVDRTFNTGK